MILSFDIGIKNMAYCLMLSKDEILSWEIVPIEGKGIHELSEDIISQLDLLFSSLDIQDILIENQPCFKAPTMKSIQMIVFTYFKIKFPQSKIHFCSASNKLKLCDDAKSVKTMTYTQRKKLAIQMAESYIVQEEFANMYKCSKKKDDLADSYLQAVYFIKTNT